MKPLYFHIDVVAESLAELLAEITYLVAIKAKAEIVRSFINFAWCKTDSRAFTNWSIVARTRKVNRKVNFAKVFTYSFAFDGLIVDRGLVTLVSKESSYFSKSVRY